MARSNIHMVPYSSSSSILHRVPHAIRLCRKLAFLTYSHAVRVEQKWERDAGQSKEGRDGGSPMYTKAIVQVLEILPVSWYAPMSTDALLTGVKRGKAAPTADLMTVFAASTFAA